MSITDYNTKLHRNDWKASNKSHLLLVVGNFQIQWACSINLRLRSLICRDAKNGKCVRNDKGEGRCYSNIELQELHFFEKSFRELYRGGSADYSVAAWPNKYKHMKISIVEKSNCQVNVSGCKLYQVTQISLWWCPAHRNTWEVEGLLIVRRIAFRCRMILISWCVGYTP